MSAPCICEQPTEANKQTNKKRSLQGIVARMIHRFAANVDRAPCSLSHAPWHPPHPRWPDGRRARCPGGRRGGGGRGRGAWGTTADPRARGLGGGGRVCE